MGPYKVNVGVQRCPPGCAVGPVYQLNWFRLCMCVEQTTPETVSPEGASARGRAGRSTPAE